MNAGRVAAPLLPEGESRRAASERAAALRHVAGPLAWRGWLPARQAAELEALLASLAQDDEDGAADEQSWLFDCGWYLRVAVIVAAEISAGELKPGQRLITRRVTARFGVAAQMAGTLPGHGWLIHCGLHVRAARADGRPPVTRPPAGEVRSQEV